MKSILYTLLYLLQFDRMADFAMMARTQIRLLRYKKKGIKINFIPQGGYELMISGDITKFEIHPTSHLKSNTYIECNGGVKIGRNFHAGRGLTIYSSAHDYKNATKIPYDETIQFQPVSIGDFVWCGANVTILPGVEVGEGVIIGAGTVVTKDAPPLSIIAGNPGRIIGERNRDTFTKLKEAELFY